ncbi:MAG: glutathione S-transferase N-terminal domain-containing protein [Pseudomonadota bacterium]
MADARSIILHQFAESPFAEKIRLALRHKNLAWAKVDIPRIMPKPDLMPLTGGYRSTPVMQIGADIYCDTAMILMELERRYPMTPLSLPGHEGLAKMVAQWTDRVWFPISAMVIFGAAGDNLPEDFRKDREAFTGLPLKRETLAAMAPMLRDQWRAHLMQIEERLEGGRGAGAGNWLISTKPGLCDVHAYMNLWFMQGRVPDFLEACFEAAPRTRDWMTRMAEAEGQMPEEISAEAALDIATASGPRLKAAIVDGSEPQGLVLGEQVAVSPADMGKVWVEGTLVHADDQCIILQRVDPRCETLHLHFPRAGFMVKRG